MLIMMIFVLSIDWVLGYAGVATLGQSAMYGAGAYAAGLVAVHVSGNPLLGLVAGIAAGAVVALVSGLALMRVHGLTLLVMSIAVAQICQEIANQARPITGGADGLSGVTVDPLFGRFEFDLVGQTAFGYALAVLAAVFLFLRMLVASPLGLSATCIRESARRMAAIGTPVHRRLVAIYTIGGAIAGLAGALSAQVTELVSLEVFSFVLSAEAVVMLVLGGAGRLYGALLGTLIFMGLQHVASAADPYTWLSAIGVLILAVLGRVRREAVGGVVDECTRGSYRLSRHRPAGAWTGRSRPSPRPSSRSGSWSTEWLRTTFRCSGPSGRFGRSRQGLRVDACFRPTTRRSTGTPS